MANDEVQEPYTRVTLTQVYTETREHGDMLKLISQQLIAIGQQLGEFKRLQDAQDEAMDAHRSRLEKLEGRYLDPDRQKALEYLIDRRLERRTDGLSLNKATRWTLVVMGFAALYQPVIQPLIHHLLHIG